MYVEVAYSAIKGRDLKFRNKFLNFWTSEHIAIITLKFEQWANIIGKASVESCHVRT